MDFNLSDPFFTEFKPGEYKPLHDPHLKNFLNKKSVRRCLLKNNFITKDGEVRCTLQEFNRFQRNLKHYFKTQKRIASALEKKKFYVDPRKVLRRNVKNAMLQNRIQLNIKIAEAKARRTESEMKRRRQILNHIIQKDKQAALLIEKAGKERELSNNRAEMEKKLRELVKIRLDSCELIRRSTILQKMKQKERQVAQKQLLKKQRRLKGMAKESLKWHKERMEAKDEELIKFLDKDTDKRAKRKRSIATRTFLNEQQKQNQHEQQKKIHEKHVRKEDIHLEEAQEWERRVEENRVRAAEKWRTKMHNKKTAAETRMAAIERRKYERKKTALARKEAKIEENLDILEKMNVTVLGTTGCGSPELANVHREKSRIRFSAYYDPGRDAIDPCRTTQFHAHFKPLHVVHARYQPGYSPKTQCQKSVNTTEIKQIENVSFSKVNSTISAATTKSTLSKAPHSDTNVPLDLADKLLYDLIASELSDVLSECVEEMESELVVDSLIEHILDDVVGNEVVRVSKGVVTKAINNALCKVEKQSLEVEPQHYRVKSLMSEWSTEPDSSWYSDDVSSTCSSLNVQDLIMDVVRRIMRAFDGNHEEVYAGQTTAEDCDIKDGETIITEIVTRLVVTIQNFSKCPGTPVSESADTILSEDHSPRESLKDLHKRAQFLLNHALDIAQVRLKLSGYSYLTWNIMEDCLRKGRDKLLNERAASIAGMGDVEIVELVMNEARSFLQDATTLMYDLMHGGIEGDDNGEIKDVIEQTYLEQLAKTNTEVLHPEMISERLLEEVAAQGDVARFAVLLVKKTLNEAVETIPRRSSIMLTEALHDGDYDLAGSILAAKSIKVAHKKLEFDPQDIASNESLKDAMRSGDVIKAGTILANRAVQQAMDIHLEKEEDDTALAFEKSISTMVLQQALQQGDLDAAGGLIIDDTLREALTFLNTPTPDISLDQALKFGDLELAGNILIDTALEQGIQQMYKEDGHVRHDSSIALETALYNGDVPKAGDIIVSRLLKSGMSELDEELADKVLNGSSSNIIPRSSSEVLRDALFTGNLEAAAPILANRAVRSAMADPTLQEDIIPMSSSDILSEALVTGDLETAAPILTNRALRSAMSDDEKGNPETNVVERNSSEILCTALTTENLEEVAPSLANRTLSEGADQTNERSSSSDGCSQGANESNSVSADQYLISVPSVKTEEELGDDVQKSEEIVVPAPSYEEIEVLKVSSSTELDVKPSISEGIYYLESSTKTNIDEEMHDRGERYFNSVLDNTYNNLEKRFDDEMRNHRELLKPHLLASDYDGAARVLVKRLLDAVREETKSETYDEAQMTHFAALLSRLVFQTCLKILSGKASKTIPISELMNDNIYKTLININIVGGADAIISMVIGKCLKVITNTTTKDVRSKSSIELFEACMSGDRTQAGGILAHKVIKNATRDSTPVDVKTFKSTDEILSEKQGESAQLIRKASSAPSVRSTKSKRKINTDGLPKPMPLSASKSRNASEDNFNPVREIIMSEEREFMVNQMVTESERSLRKSQMRKSTSSVKVSGTDLAHKDSIKDSVERLAEFCDQQLQLKPREEGDAFVKKSSDVSLPLLPEETSNESLGYVRKIQSKGHIYYISEDGIIKKRARRKRASKKRLSQDDLNIIPEQNSEKRVSQHENVQEPQAVSSESSLLKPNDLPSNPSKKSINQRRSSIKKNESSLQVLAVINSSYSNMLGKKSSNEMVYQNREFDVSASTGESRVKSRPSIDDLLSETDKQLIRDLSNASVKEKQSE